MTEDGPGVDVADRRDAVNGAAIPDPTATPVPSAWAAFRATTAVSPRRWARLVGGLALYGLAIAAMMRGGVGLGPWDLFHQGLARVLPISVGVASQLVGALLLVGLGLAGARFGMGTLLNIVGIGLFLDLWLRVVPEAPTATAGWAMHAAGIVGTGVATALYLAARMGAGPRDSLMLELTRRTGRSLRGVRTGIELVVLAAGWALGGTLGLGTLAFALGIGPATQAALRVLAPDLVRHD